MRNIVIVGGGFAGVWAALGATREAASRTRSGQQLDITLVSPEPWLTIRPRLYEGSPQTLCVPLAGVLGPAGVSHVEARARQIDTRARTVTADTTLGELVLPYDRLILAAGSRLHRPVVPGAELALSVDSYADALALDTHLSTLSARTGPGRFTAVVVGAGFTGIEVATELVTRLRRIAAQVQAEREVRVVLVERAAAVAPDLGPDARKVVEGALRELDIQSRVQSSVAQVQASGVRLDNGEWIPAATTIWTGGFRASELAEQLNVA